MVKNVNELVIDVLKFENKYNEKCYLYISFDFLKVIILFIIDFENE